MHDVDMTVYIPLPRLITCIIRVIMMARVSVYPVDVFYDRTQTQKTHTHTHSQTHNMKILHKKNQVITIIN